ncbi:MAG: site-specific tyrosine recombinase XerD [Steroidobacteraceae bacterium]
MTPLEHALARWLEALAVKALARSTIGMRRRCLHEFIRWCAERGIETPAQVTRSVIERYQRHLYYARIPEGTTKNGRKVGLGQPLSLRTQHLYLSTLTGFFGWLTKQHWIGANPAADLDLPKSPRHRLREPLTQAEVEAVLAATSQSGELGVRDRAIIETLYATGIRSFECGRLTIYDVDTVNGTLLVREGKGKKDRLLPIGERACAWIDKYTSDLRPQLLIDANERTLFLSYRGAPLSNTTLGMMVRGYFKQVGITKLGACHLFRHAMATAMLDNGADIRYIQVLLGHSNLNTTTVYTHVSLAKLREVYVATHPAKATRTPHTADARGADLLAALDAEGQAENPAGPA